MKPFLEHIKSKLQTTSRFL